MTITHTFDHMKGDDVAAVARLVRICFAGTPAGVSTWMEEAGRQHIRVMRSASGTPEACLLRIPMGQYFGGCSIPMVGIAAVGVAPEARGTGLARTMMSEALREIRADGVPLSTLYASTQSLYRSVGYQQAGHRAEIRLPVAAIDVRERTLAVRPIAESDQPAVRQCYARFASHFDGPLDRGDYVWSRVRKTRDVAYDGFAAVGESGDIDGYIYLTTVRRPEGGRQDLLLSDVAFTTARAGRRLLTLLADFGSMVDDIVFFGGPMHPALFLLSQQRFRLDLRDHWLLRIVDVRSALELRPYPLGAAGSFTFHLRDHVLADNQGTWTLHVQGGRGHAERAQSAAAALTMDIPALASLYAGYLSARQLRLLGALDGPEDAIAACDHLLAATTPWMSDMF
jgi:predicted acetyltransferase